jgi:hypothetical protein
MKARLSLPPLEIVSRQWLDLHRRSECRRAGEPFETCDVACPRLFL